MRPAIVDWGRGGPTGTSQQGRGQGCLAHCCISGVQGTAGIPLGSGERRRPAQVCSTCIQNEPITHTWISMRVCESASSCRTTYICKEPVLRGFVGPCLQAQRLTLLTPSTPSDREETSM